MKFCPRCGKLATEVVGKIKTWVCPTHGVVYEDASPAAGAKDPAVVKELNSRPTGTLSASETGVAQTAGSEYLAKTAGSETLAQTARGATGLGAAADPLQPGLHGGKDPAAADSWAEGTQFEGKLLVPEKPKGPSVAYASGYKAKTP